MWITDIIEVLNLLCDGKTEWHKLINKIENNYIVFSDGQKVAFSDIKEIANVVEFRKRMKRGD